MVVGRLVWDAKNTSSDSKTQCNWGQEKKFAVEPGSKIGKLPCLYICAGESGDMWLLVGERESKKAHDDTSRLPVRAEGASVGTAPGRARGSPRSPGLAYKR